MMCKYTRPQSQETTHKHDSIFAQSPRGLADRETHDRCRHSPSRLKTLRPARRVPIENKKGYLIAVCRYRIHKSIRRTTLSIFPFLSKSTVERRQWAWKTCEDTVGVGKEDMVEDSKRAESEMGIRRRRAGRSSFKLAR